MIPQLLTQMLPMALGALGGKDQAQQGQQLAQGTGAPTLNQLGGKEQAKVSPIFNNMAQEGIGQLFNNPSKRGRDAGKADKAYFDTFAPETNDWERLGQGSVGTPVAAAQAQGKEQRQLTQMNNETSKEIARMQTDTQQIVAAINAVAPNRQANIAEMLGPGQLGLLSEQAASEIGRQVLLSNQANTEYHRGEFEAARAGRERALYQGYEDIDAFNRATGGLGGLPKAAGSAAAGIGNAAKNTLGFGTKTAATIAPRVRGSIANVARKPLSARQKGDINSKLKANRAGFGMSNKKAVPKTIMGVTEKQYKAAQKSYKGGKTKNKAEWLVRKHDGRDLKF